MKTDPYSPLNVAYFSAIVLISQGVPQLGAINNGEMAKTSFHTMHTRLSRAYLALDRLSCKYLTTYKIEGGRLNTMSSMKNSRFSPLRPIYGHKYRGIRNVILSHCHSQWPRLTSDAWWSINCS